jgi:hypothetical protein
MQVQFGAIRPLQFKNPNYSSDTKGYLVTQMIALDPRISANEDITYFSIPRYIAEADDMDNIQNETDGSLDFILTGDERQALVDKVEEHDGDYARAVFEVFRDIIKPKFEGLKTLKVPELYLAEAPFASGAPPTVDISDLERVPVIGYW